jgi:hypothetical protein
MSYHVPTRSLQREQLERAGIRIRMHTPVARCDQPIDGVQIVVYVDVGLPILGARLELHVVTVHTQRHNDGAVTEACCGEQRHRRGVRHRAGFSAYRKHVALEFQNDRAATHGRMFLGQPPCLLHRISEQHRLERRTGTSGQLSEQLQQSLQPVGIAADAVDESGIRRDPRVELLRSGRERRHAIADRMSQTAQQFVMNGQPSLCPNRVQRLAGP